MNSKSLFLSIVLSETINILRNLQKTNIFRMPPRILSYVYVHVAPSSDPFIGDPQSLSLPFKVILNLRRFEVIFWCLEWECCTFQTTVDNSNRSNPSNAILWLLKRFIVIQEHDTDGNTSTVNSACKPKALMLKMSHVQTTINHQW